MSAVAGTTPYAWPYDGVVDPGRTALVVTGGGGWSPYVPADPDADANLERLRSALLECGVAVVVVAHTVPTGRLRAADTPAPELVARPDEIAVTAAGIDGFYGSPLDAVLRAGGRTHLLVAGHGLESTVHSTVRRANDRGYECLTVVDAASAHESALRHASRSSIEMSGGIFGAVGATADVLAAYPP